MKKMYRLLFVALLVAIGYPVSAQNATEIEVKAKNKYSDNWFISLGAGGNLLMGEQDAERSVGDRLRFGGEFSVGKWFNPDFGMRLQVMGGSLRGFNLLEDQGGEYTRNDRNRFKFPTGADGVDANNTIIPGNLDVDGDPFNPKDYGFWQDMKYGTITLDLMANLTNLFRGYYKESPFELSGFIGAGYIHGFKSDTNPQNSGLVGKIGARANYNFNKNWSVFLEPQANFASEEFDGYVGNRGFDVITNVNLGIQYNFNKDFSLIGSLSSDEINMINKKINEHRQLIENHQDILERQQNLLDKLDKCCDEKEVVTKVIQEPKGGYVPEYIRFGLDSSSIELSEKSKVEDAATYLKANPKSKLLLIGYADKKTGNPKYNMELSRKRVDSVAGGLKQLGVSDDQLIIKWIGDKEQPYDQNDWNRVVIMVERK